MAVVKIISEIGKNCITLDQGAKLYNRIHPLLKKGENVVLDFQHVEVFASPFFNRSVGRLLEDISPDDLNRLLVVNNLAVTGLDTLKKVIENSKKYYSNPNYKKAVDKTLKENPTDVA